MVNIQILNSILSDALPGIFVGKSQLRKFFYISFRVPKTGTQEAEIKIHLMFDFICKYSIAV